jgi:hypothetical protein
MQPRDGCTTAQAVLAVRSRRCVRVSGETYHTGVRLHGVRALVVILEPARQDICAALADRPSDVTLIAEALGRVWGCMGGWTRAQAVSCRWSTMRTRPACARARRARRVGKSTTRHVVYTSPRFGYNRVRMCRLGSHAAELTLVGHAVDRSGRRRRETGWMATRCEDVVTHPPHTEAWTELAARAERLECAACRCSKRLMLKPFG